MYVIIEAILCHLKISFYTVLVIVRITLNVIVRQMPLKVRKTTVGLSLKICCQILWQCCFHLLLWHFIVSIELHANTAGMLLHINGKSQCETWKLSLLWQSFVLNPPSHCQILGVGQNTLLWLWYPLFQAQWDRCDQQIHKIYNYLVKGHLYSGTWN